MAKWKRGLILFGIGAAGYSLTEILARGHTHWTMTLTGGVVYMTLYHMHTRLKHRSFLLRCALGALIITAYELCVGLMVNRLLHWDVWDYSDRFMNLWGQIAPRFTMYWFLINLPLVPLSEWLERKFAFAGPVKMFRRI